MKRLLGIFAISALVLAWTGPADAHTRIYRSQVQIANVPLGAGTAQGTVTSPRDECRINRTVTLLLNTSFFSQDQTDVTGTWSITTTFPAGAYTAVIDNLVFKKNGRHRHRCAADNSDAFNNN